MIADGLILLLNDQGRLTVAEAAADAYRVLGEFEVLERPAWAPWPCRGASGSPRPGADEVLRLAAPATPDPTVQQCPGAPRRTNPRPAADQCNRRRRDCLVVAGLAVWLIDRSGRSGHASRSSFGIGSTSNRPGLIAYEEVFASTQLEKRQRWRLALS